MDIKMEQLLYLGWAVISSDEVPARHYFLEMLNTPECIWGIRALGVAAVLLVFFLYRKLKEKNGE